MNEIEEFLELMNTVDVTELDLIDQFTIGMAYTEMVSKVKPVLLRHIASKNDKTGFLFKL